MLLYNAVAPFRVKEKLKHNFLMSRYQFSSGLGITGRANFLQKRNATVIHVRSTTILECGQQVFNE